jgi:hypothetical protein
MTKQFRMVGAMLVALTAVLAGSATQADIVTPVTGWVLHNGTSSFTGVSEATSSPQLSVADNLTIMAPFSGVTLPNVGDFITIKTTMNLGTRTSNLNANNLNTQLRIGLLNGTADPIVAGDAGYTGFLTIYSNQLAMASYGNLSEQQSNGATSPLQGQTTLGTPPSAGVDAGGDSISGGDPISADFTLTLTHRDTGMEIYSNISSAQFNYLQEVTFGPYTPGLSGFDFSTFNFNRAAFFFGPNVDGTNGGGLNNTMIITGNAVPESRFGLLAVAVAMGCVLTGLKMRRAWLRRNQQPA